jgi:hypothetical protein
MAEADEAAWRAGSEMAGVLGYTVGPEVATRLWEVSERRTD